MGLKEKYKRWNRSWYELSVDELLKKKKHCRLKQLIFSIIPMLIAIYLLFIMYGIEVTQENALLVILTLIAMLIILETIYIIFFVLSLDYHRDIADLNILIYLKQKHR